MAMSATLRQICWKKKKTESEESSSLGVSFVDDEKKYKCVINTSLNEIKKMKCITHANGGYVVVCQS